MSKMHFLLVSLLLASIMISIAGAGCDLVARISNVSGNSISIDDLPSEALDTLDLIQNDGPFPYKQDGAVFNNREGLLPGQPSGYYHEYTVDTPGSSDRGARRIITGEKGEFYYTDDHYASFKLITGISDISGDSTPNNQATSPSPTDNEIKIKALPPEARETLRLIKNGGPFPYKQDNTVFSNYEGLLPKQPQGYYHEYTVVTPGASNRGTRRIIAGKGGEYYYTDDHYASFKRILE
jgi:guanyl-specific ribonuclease Sa